LHFSDLVVIKRANDDLARRLVPSVVRSRTASRAGQRAFDFRIEAAPAKIITLRRPADERASRLPQAVSGASKDASRAADVSAVARDSRRAEEYFRVGSALDYFDQANVEEAAIAYRTRWSAIRIWSRRSSTWPTFVRARRLAEAQALRTGDRPRV
jgi:hypothetical protein